MKTQKFGGALLEKKLNKMDKDNILNTILEILKSKVLPLSIRELTNELEKKGIKKNEKTVLKYLKVLEESKKIEELKKNKK